MLVVFPRLSLPALLLHEVAVDGVIEMAVSFVNVYGCNVGGSR